MLSQSFHVLPKALALPDVMITVKRYFDRSTTSTLIWLLLFGLAAGHFSNILSDTQGNMFKKTNKKNTLLQSGAQAGKVPVGDITYAALSKDGGITTIYRASYPNQTVMLTSENGIQRKNCWVNTALTDIRWLNGFNPGRGIKRAWNGSAVQSLHSVNHLSVTETDVAVSVTESLSLTLSLLCLLWMWLNVRRWLPRFNQSAPKQFSVRLSPYSWWDVWKYRLQSLKNNVFKKKRIDD